MTDTAILLAGHGTRAVHGQQNFLQFVNLVRTEIAYRYPRLRRVPVSACYLELVHPAIESEIVRLYAQGIRRIVFAPVFLFRAGHLKQDIPGALSHVKMACPDLTLIQTGVLGLDGRLLETAATRLRSSGFDASSQRNTTVVLIGRGSRDAAANEDFAQVASLLQNMCKVADMATCQLAGPGPRLPEVLSQCATRGTRQFYLLPYLLFTGRLTDALPTTVGAWQETQLSHTEIIITQHLGVHARVVDAVVERIFAASPHACQPRS